MKISMRALLWIFCGLCGLPWAAEGQRDALSLELPSAPNSPGSVTSSTSDFRVEDAVVRQRRRAEATTAARFDVDIGQLRVIPRANAAEQLMMAPGVLTTNHGGEGHAQETFMRGFASKEGQDIEFLVDGIPINEISNPHNHGYADLFFIPPELVQKLSITEGAFDPEQGDFAFAGTAAYTLGVDQRGSRILYGRGSFNSQRTLLVYAPKGEEPGTFASIEHSQSDGYGQNRSFELALAVGRFADDWGKQQFKYALSVFGYATRYDSAGVVRQDDYEAGRVGFFSSYDTNQGGESNRLLFSLSLEAGPEDSLFKAVSFLGWRTMRLRTNFTGWMSDTAIDSSGSPRRTQRGDNLESRYRTLSGGSRGSYTLARTAEIWGEKLRQELTFGYALRFDQGQTSQYRLRSVTAIPYLVAFNREFTVLNLAGWVRAQIQPLSWLRIRGGVRLDSFSFGILDLNQPASDREGSRVPNQSSQSFGLALNPRVSADLRVLRDLHLVLSYGQGTRSSDASGLSDNETAPFSKAQEFDVGVVYKSGHPIGPIQQLSGQLSYSLSLVNKDLLFDELAGRTLLVGASRRHALLFNARAELWGWAELLANFGWTEATLDRTGERMPYIPRAVTRLDAAVFGHLWDWELGGVPVHGRVGLGFSWVPGRPLPNKQFGDGFELLNLGAELRLWHFSLGLETRNLLNRRYRQVEFHYASNFSSPSALPSKRPMLHFVGGEPFYAMASLTWHIESMLFDDPSRARAGAFPANSGSFGSP